MELWDIYDSERNKTGKIAERGKYKFNENEYHIVVIGVIINSKKEILISQRAQKKKYPYLWECSGGSVLKDETSVEGVVRELKEELGIKLTTKEAILLKQIKREMSEHKELPDFKDIWVFKKDIEINELKFTDGEAINAQWVTIEKFMDMYDKNEIVPQIGFGLEEYKKAIELLKL